MAGKTHEYGATRIFLYTFDGVNPDVLLSAVDAISAIPSPKGGAWSVGAELVEWGDGYGVRVTVHARDHHGCLRRGRHAVMVGLRAGGVDVVAVTLRDISKPPPHTNRGEHRTGDTPTHDEHDDEHLVLHPIVCQPIPGGGVDDGYSDDS